MLQIVKSGLEMKNKIKSFIKIPSFNKNVTFFENGRRKGLQKKRKVLYL